MTDFRILVTGSREWADLNQVFNALDAALADYAWQAKRAGEDWTITVVHGACPTGADKFAHLWYESRRALWGEHVQEDPHPADWARLGKLGGPARNQVMVDKGAVRCLAFYWHGSANLGTGDCVGLASEAGILVTSFYGNGPEWTS